LIFSAITKDGMLSIDVWLDNTPQTDWMCENGIEAMGVMTVYNNHRDFLELEERVPLSSSAVNGQGPTEEDEKIWHETMDQFYTG
jgi:hypothetical protein